MSQTNNSRPTRRPQINTAGITDPAVKAAIRAIAERMEVGDGNRPNSNIRDKVLRVGDLIDAGMLKIRSLMGGMGIQYTQPDLVDFTVPPAPTGFTASGALQTVVLYWDPAPFKNYSHTEIWRSALDGNGDPINDVGQATLVGTSVPAVAKDNIGGGGRYYYWIRFISAAGVAGPFNAVAGTLGETSYDPAYILDILTIKWKPANIYAAGSYVIPSPAEETGLWYKTVSGGVSGASEPTWPTVVGGTVLDGTCLWQAVSAGSENPTFLVGEVNGVPTLVMRGDIVADGTIIGRMIKAGEVTAEKIFVVSLAAISANLGAITAGSLNINGKFIVDANGNVTILSATSGARTEIRNNVIKVYDASGVLRVRIGDLTA